MTGPANALPDTDLTYVATITNLGPGAADTVHYRIKVPEDSSGKIHLKNPAPAINGLVNWAADPTAPGIAATGLPCFR